MDIFEELNATGRTILMVTHERHIAEHAERIVHLVDGETERVEQLDSAGRKDGSEGSTAAGTGAES
jgi:putative ABC transport system ATP-binding protein